MKIQPISSFLWLLLGALFAAGCGGEGPVPGAPCATAQACGPIGDAVCVDGFCQAFDEASGWGNATINLSFKTELYQTVASGYVSIVLDHRPDGTRITCEDILSGQLPEGAEDFNPLQSNPKYLVFHWSHGGTFFPNNLVQFIRPADSVLAVARGYSGLEGGGSMTALGCEPAVSEDPISILADQTVEFTIQLNAP